MPKGGERAADPTNDAFKLAKGDVVRTHCNWENGTDTELSFPREMCFGIGFFLATGATASAPVCINGTWMER